VAFSTDEIIVAAMAQQTIAGRLDNVRERIAVSLKQTGRHPDDVVLIAVSKKQPVESIREAYEAGQRDFGENYVQELVGKAHALADLKDIRWHFIGHLQANKVKQALDVASMVHTVDRVSLARELGKRMPLGRTLDVLVEVNVGAEESKTGALVEDVARVVDAVRWETRLRLQGFMTVPPFDMDLDVVARYFAGLRGMAERFGLRELSMGMSHDFDVAIAHGATMVRVGTLIFGER